MCAINKKTNASGCIFDDGAPLLYKSPASGRSWAIGIASAYDYDLECGHQEAPSVFTRVDAFLDFIKDQASYACVKNFE